MGVSSLRWMTSNVEVIRGQKSASGKSDQMDSDKWDEQAFRLVSTLAIFGAITALSTQRDCVVANYLLSNGEALIFRPSCSMCSGQFI